MIAEDLLFWIVATDSDTMPDAKLLCRRHADAMVVPNGWTLDDRRQPAPSLFQTRRYATAAPVAPAPTPALGATSARRHVRHVAAQAMEQLMIDGTGPIPRPSSAELAASDTTASDTTASDTTENASADEVLPEDPAAEDAKTFGEWRPDFDIDDDLDGLLETKSPLLSRAFRGIARQR